MPATIEITPMLIAEFVGVLEVGGSWMTAGEVAGLHPDTVRKWRRRGEADLLEGRDTQYAAFVAETSRARGRGKLRALRSLTVAMAGSVVEETVVVSTGRDGTVTETRRTRRAPPDSRAAIAVLRWSERDYAEIQRIEHSGPDQGPIPVAVTQALARMTDAQLAEVEAALDGYEPPALAEPDPTEQPHVIDVEAETADNPGHPG